MGMYFFHMTNFTPESDTPGNPVSLFKMLNDSLTGIGLISILFDTLLP